VPEVTVHERVAMAAEAVWTVIGGFDAIQKWATVVRESVIEDSTTGTVRALTMGDGSIVREALVTASEFSYSYRLLDRPAMPDHLGTVAVVPLDSEHCRIVMEVHLSATPELSDEDITARYDRFLGSNMKAMKRALGLA
jgi:hypothetical protein